MRGNNVSDGTLMSIISSLVAKATQEARHQIQRKINSIIETFSLDL